VRARARPDQPRLSRSATPNRADRPGCARPVVAARRAKPSAIGRSGQVLLPSAGVLNARNQVRCTVGGAFVSDSNEAAWPSVVVRVPARLLAGSTCQVEDVEPIAHDPPMTTAPPAELHGLQSSFPAPTKEKVGGRPHGAIAFEAPGLERVCRVLGLHQLCPIRGPARVSLDSQGPTDRLSRASGRGFFDSRLSLSIPISRRLDYIRPRPDPVALRTASLSGQELEVRVLGRPAQTDRYPGSLMQGIRLGEAGR
jgi:hypothetical protein